MSLAAQNSQVVVLGGTRAAVLTAGLLARRNLRTVLIDQGELAGTPAGLFPDLLVSPEGSMPIRIVHEELGLTHELRVHTRPIKPVLQVIYPDQRLDLSTERESAQKEVQRAFGSSAGHNYRALLGELDSFENEGGSFLSEIGALPPSGFFERRSAVRVKERFARATAVSGTASALGSSHEAVQELALALSPFLTYLDATGLEGMSLLRFARPVARFFRGLSRLDDGRSFRERVLEHVGATLTVIRGAVEQIRPRRGAATLRLAGEREPLETSAVVDASADLSGLATLPLPDRPSKLAIALQAATPKGYLRVLSLVLDRTALPPALAETVLLLNGRKDARLLPSGQPDGEDRPMLLLVRKHALPGRVRLILLHPLSRVRAQAVGVDRIDEVMRARLSRLIPFLEQSRPEMTALSSQGGARDAAASAEHPLFDPELDPIAGVGGVAMRTPWKHILIGGPAVLPGLGAEGEYLTALRAADQVEAVFRGNRRPAALAARIKKAPLILNEGRAP
jgi:hypothetical protein